MAAQRRPPTPDRVAPADSSPGTRKRAADKPVKPTIPPASVHEAVEAVEPVRSRPAPFELRSLLWLTVAVLVAFAGLAVFRVAGHALTQVAMGVILALALDPLVLAASTRFNVNRTRAVAIVASSFGALLVTLIVFVGPPATRQASQFGKQLPVTITQFEEFPVIGTQLKRFELRQTVEDWVNKLPDRFDAETVQVAATRVLSDTFSIVVVACLVVGALLDGPRLLALIRSPFRKRPDVSERVDWIGRVVSLTLGQYFGGSLTVATLMGLFVLIVGLVLTIPLAPLAALWAAFTDLIPQVGGFLGGSFFIVLALTKGPGTALIAAGLFVVYMNLENHVISPAIVGESVDLTPATTMVAAFVGGAVAGLPGSLVATPLVGATKRLYLELRTGKRTEIPTKKSWKERFTQLRNRLFKP